MNLYLFLHREIARNSDANAAILMAPDPQTAFYQIMRSHSNLFRNLQFPVHLNHWEDHGYLDDWGNEGYCHWIQTNDGRICLSLTKVTQPLVSGEVFWNH